MIYKRNFHLYSSWKTTLLVILVFFGPITLLSILNATGVLGSWLDQSVNQALFGKYFVWFHLFTLIILACGITLLTVASKAIPFFENHVQYLMKREKAQFIAQYHIPPKELSALNPKRPPSYLYLLMILSTFMGVPVLFLYQRLLPNFYFQPIAGILGFSAIAIPFYYCAQQLMKQAVKSTQPVLAYIQTQLPDSQLQLEQGNIDYSMINPSMHASGGLYGTLQGYQVRWHVEISGEAYSRRTELAGKMQAIVQFPKALSPTFSIQISEKKIQWRKISDATIDQCFDQRFTVHGTTTALLPNRIKLLCLENDRPLFLTLSNVAVNFDSKNLVIYPAYTIYGQILFLDFLIKLAKCVQTTPLV